MTTSAAGTFPQGGLRDTLAALLARDGSGAHDHCRALGRTQATTRDLADAVHMLCVLHGRLPGVIDLAANKHGNEVALDWLLDAVAGFATERAYLTRLVVAAGPLPSTPGQAESEAAVLGQRHALEMLAGSDRRGCALGAAVALVRDWTAIRAMLDVAAHRFGVDPTPSELPDTAQSQLLADRIALGGGLDRAFAFGAQQLLVQHRGLWSLLESRRAARG